MNKLSKYGMWLMMLAGVITFIAAFIPLWVIDLDAPQYPEGLQLIIGGFAGLSGNLDSVNDLNHYVGMAKLNPADFWEFQILPWLLMIYGVLFVVTGFLKSKKMTLVDLVLFGLFAILGFIDFYRWEYNYGHNLSDDAPIKIPGGDFQPPLIGYKKLANFEVFSQPGIGGWLLIIAGIIIFLVVCYEFGIIRKVFGKKPQKT
jgi:copper chaperone NosL